MRRAEVWWAELPPPVGPRPVVVLTRNAVSDTIGAVVVALVTRTSRGLPTEVSVGKAEGLPRPSVVNTDNILTVPRQRLVRLMGQIHAALAYYHDHREALDAHIAQQLADVDRIAGVQQPSLLREKLKRTTRTGCPDSSSLGRVFESHPASFACDPCFP
jgi:mRNA interferase MazF